MSGNVIESHLANNFKKNEREKIENYRSVNILNCFSKVYEKFLLGRFKPFITSFLSEYMAAHRENYSSNHV